MSSKDLTLYLKVKDLATSTFNQFKSNVTKGTSQISGQWLNLGNVITGVFSVAAVKRFIEASNEQEKAIAKLNAAISNTGETYEGASKDIQNYANELQKTTVYSDDAIENAQAMLISITGTTNGIKPLTKATLDLATAYGIGAEEAAKLIAKTINGSDALKRYGIEIGKVEGQGERTAKVIEVLGSKFGGFAEKEGRTAAGRMQIMANAMGELEETAGDFAKSLITDLLPALQAVLPIIGKSFTTAVEVIKIAFAGIFTAIAGIGAAIEGLLNMLGISQSKFFAQLAEAGVQVIGQSAEAIGAVWSNAAAATTTYGETVTKEVKKSTPTLAEHKTLLDQIIRGYKDLAQKTIPEMPKAISKVSDAWIDSKKVSIDAIDLMSMEIMELSGFLQNQFQGIVSAMSNSINMAFSGARGAGKEFLKAILLQFIDTVQGMIIAAKAAAIAKGILTFGITVGPDIAALIGASLILQTARYFVARMHKGGELFVNAPSQREVPILVRGQETVRVTTPEQEKAEMAGRGAITLIINNYSTMTAEEGIKAAIEEGLRKTGLAVSDYFSNNRNSIALAL